MHVVLAHENHAMYADIFYFLLPVLFAQEVSSSLAKLLLDEMVSIP